MTGYEILTPQLIAEQNLARGLVPCHNQGGIFTSPYPADHAIAAPLCGICPAKSFAACADLLASELTEPYADPEGTYAGQLVNPKKRPLRRSVA